MLLGRERAVETAGMQTRQSKCALTIYAQIRIVFLAPKRRRKQVHTNATC